MTRLPTKPHYALLKRLGENVRRARLAKGLTQEGLAELVDLHPRVVQKIEAGKTNILATTAVRLQAALDCPWAALMPMLKEAVKQQPTLIPPSLAAMADHPERAQVLAERLLRECEKGNPEAIKFAQSLIEDGEKAETSEARQTHLGKSVA